MINRVCALEENAKGKPKKTNFGGDVDHVSEQAGDLFICYKKANNKRHKAIYILFKHSPNLYCVFTSRANKVLLEASPLNGVRLKAYANQATHAWRLYSVDGIDSALQSGYQSVIDRIIKVTEQPPATVSVNHPYTVGTLSATSLKPTIGVTIGDIFLKDIEIALSDVDDLPSELEDFKI
jgi:hypothetical protein